MFLLCGVQFYRRQMSNFSLQLSKKLLKIGIFASPLNAEWLAIAVKLTIYYWHIDKPRCKKEGRKMFVLKSLGLIRFTKTTKNLYVGWRNYV